MLRVNRSFDLTCSNTLTWATYYGAPMLLIGNNYIVYCMFMINVK